MDIVSDKDFLITKLAPPTHYKPKKKINSMDSSPKTNMHKKAKRGSKRRKMSKIMVKKSILKSSGCANNIDTDISQVEQSSANKIAKGVNNIALAAPLSPDCYSNEKSKQGIWHDKEPMDDSIIIPTKSTNYKFDKTMNTNNGNIFENSFWLYPPIVHKIQTHNPVQSEQTTPRANKKAVHFRPYVDVATVEVDFSPSTRAPLKKGKYKRRTKYTKTKKSCRLPEWNFSTKICDSTNKFKANKKRKNLAKKVLGDKLFTDVPNTKTRKVFRHKHDKRSITNNSVLAENAITFLRRKINRRRRLVHDKDNNLKLRKRKRIKKKFKTKPKSGKALYTPKINESVIGAPHLGYHIRALAQKTDKNTKAKRATVRDYIEKKSRSNFRRVQTKLQKFPKNLRQKKTSKNDSPAEKTAEVLPAIKIIKRKLPLKRKKNVNKKNLSGTSINITICEEALIDNDSCASDETIEDSDEIY